jgi:hypothetical protein
VKYAAPSNFGTTYTFIPLFSAPLDDELVDVVALDGEVLLAALLLAELLLAELPQAASAVTVARTASAAAARKRVRLGPLLE